MDLRQLCNNKIHHDHSDIYKKEVIFLNDLMVVEREGFEPSRHSITALIPTAMDHSVRAAYHHKSVCHNIHLV